MLELICRELGVEIGEKWLGNDGFEYKINKDGILIMYYQGSDGNEALEVTNDSWVGILMGELKPIWKPKQGDICYVPYIHSKEGERQLLFVWGDDKHDDYYFENNLVFKTKEEAIEAANKMIDAIK